MDLHSLDDMILYDSNSDDELETIGIVAVEEQRLAANSSSRSRRNSNRHCKFIWRNSLQGHQRLFLDYFADPPVYPSNIFWRRFQMKRSLFLCIQYAVEAHESCFVQKRNSAGVLGLSSLQKMIAALRILTYEVAADFMDKCLRIVESTAMKSLYYFVKAVVEIYSDQYLRSPNNNDIARLLAIGKSRGFPGMMGSIDCMYWTWKNCLAAWKGLIMISIY
ncbi:uncharacterized protein LOC114295376 [Camellia sinensis]|uniref:uncharacterized protein LOC114295376 n=1 Tax=Camellia sinensis TaxID=4442 RepID=UPI0010368651|nr:uncharacterized protein LOC114295376 [Camellia sinensis]